MAHVINLTGNQGKRLHEVLGLSAKLPDAEGIRIGKLRGRLSRLLKTDRTTTAHDVLCPVFKPLKYTPQDQVPAESIGLPILRADGTPVEGIEYDKAMLSGPLGELSYDNDERVSLFRLLLALLGTEGISGAQMEDLYHLAGWFPGLQAALEAARPTEPMAEAWPESVE